MHAEQSGADCVDYDCDAKGLVQKSAALAFRGVRFASTLALRRS